METGGVLRRIADLARASPGEVGLLALLAAVVLGGGAFVFLRTSEPPPPPIQETSMADEPAPSPSPKVLVVHVAGAVASPGIYELAEFSRVADAVEAAGGALEDADLDLLNLAALLADGQKVYVPRKGEPPPPGSGSGEITGKVNLNTANQAELEELPGVGPVLAQRIIQFREKRGGFTSIRQLMEVEGIGPKKFESLKDLVVV